MNQPPNELSEELLELLSAAFESHQLGKLDQAEKLYKQLAPLLPDSWQIHFNLGLLLFEQGRLEESCREYEHGLQMAGPNSDLYYNYAICLKQAGNLDGALSAYEDALNLEPENVEILYNRACCLSALQRFEEAFEAYNDVLKRDPGFLPALNNQAYVCHRLGHTDLAIKRYREIVTLDPEHASADHMLAALTGSARIITPESYVREVFDEYSVHYEKSLIEHLKYQVPEKLLQQVRKLSYGRQFTTMLDLGCGTGLIGETFRDNVKILHGVDLSGKMLALAGKKMAYDQLSQTSISQYLSYCEPETYELIAAADVFNYLGELTETFVQIHDVITESGLFFFTVENLRDDSGSLRLNSSGRFAHSAEYIKTTALRTGWNILSSTELNLRREGNGWVSGTLYGLQKLTDFRQTERISERSNRG